VHLELVSTRVAVKIQRCPPSNLLTITRLLLGDAGVGS
jgi:hypothetical protein